MEAFITVNECKSYLCGKLNGQKFRRWYCWNELYKKGACLLEFTL